MAYLLLSSGDELSAEVMTVSQSPRYGCRFWRAMHEDLAQLADPHSSKVH
jgi:hypothetical protein